MKLRRTRTFERSYASMSDEMQMKAEKAIRLMLQDFHHPSLHTKKMSGRKNIWEARVDYHYRFTFMIDGEVIILRVIGNHDEVLKNP